MLPWNLFMSAESSSAVGATDEGGAGAGVVRRAPGTEITRGKLSRSIKFEDLPRTCAALIAS